MGHSLFDLTGQAVAVIGAGSGIGEAVAGGCAQAGARVVCLDVDAAAVTAAADKIGAAGTAETLDIRDPEAVLERLEAVRRQHGKLDGVVCTPGVNVRKPVLDYTSEEFDRVVGLNLKGTFHVLQAAGRIMRDQRAGSIVVFSSIRARTVEPGQGVYASTKSGLIQLARTLAVELGPFGVRVNAVAPGVVDTPLTKPIKDHPSWYGAYAARNALNRWARADEVAGPTVFLLSQAASYVTGAVLFVDGGWTAIDGRFSPPGMTT